MAAPRRARGPARRRSQGILAAAASAAALVGVGVASQSLFAAGPWAAAPRGRGLVARLALPEPEVAEVDALGGLEEEEQVLTKSRTSRRKRKSTRLEYSFRVLLDSLKEKLGRKVDDEDLPIEIDEDTDTVPQARFVATLELGCMPGKPSRVGWPQAKKSEAKDSAAQAFLLDFPRLERQLSLGAEGELDFLVERKLRREVTEADLSYAVKEDPEAGPEARYSATVELGCLKDGPSATGAKGASAAEARSMAASALMAEHPDLDTLLTRAAVGVVEGMVRAKLGREPEEGDLRYTVGKIVAGAAEEARFVGRVALGCLEGVPSFIGEPQSTEEEARQSAAEGVLEDEIIKAYLNPDAVEALGLMVQRKFRRTNSEKDVSYEVTEIPDGPPEKRYMATVTLGCLPLTPELDGPARGSPEEAMRAAAEEVMNFKQAKEALAPPRRGRRE